ncbi:flagellar hook-associated protein 3 [Syntrophotalea acetylenivorans]|uniref:Flagellar hook-associated protein 3 n=1 Tax=Syntrophotalea acetylenivorans TaxID=1842532 RepID=A0A1L3GN25_9BACT|nr:flagellar hook-associated protein FlgL [Syntrophotalea acetylenivorans]APG27346.1 flagellar hook-associated protein 3 [Syntrophotalea acetylenivorans]
MKTTQSTVYRSLQNQIYKTQSSLLDLRMSAATGKRINKPSDDPSAIRPVLNARSQMQKSDRYLRTMGSASDRLDILDSHLGQIGNLMIRAQETTISAGNAAMGPNDLTNLSDAIGHIKDELLALANSNVDGKYIFAGFAEDTQPFPGTDPLDPFAYEGDGGHMELEIAPGERIQANLTGDELFQGAGGGINLFEVLDDIQTQLANGNAEAALSRLGDLQDGTEQVSRQRSQMGNIGARVENAQEHMESIKIDMQEVLSRYEDADLVEVITALTQQEQAFEAALNVTAKVSNLSILDYL